MQASCGVMPLCDVVYVKLRHPRRICGGIRRRGCILAAAKETTFMRLWTLRTLRLVVVVAGAGILLCGCQHQAPPEASNSSGTSASSSEAERTKAMEEKARELDRRAADIQNMQGTEQEKIDAVNKLEQERQQMSKAADDGSAP